MKRMKFVLCGAMGLFLGSACSESTVPEAAPEPWNLVVSRAEGAEEDDTYNHILVMGEQDGVTELSGVLAVDGTSSSWEGTAPSWPTDKTLAVYAISPVPEGNVLPTTIDLTTGKGTAWLIDYQSQQQTKPSTLTMSHILAKLVVHIRIDGEVNPQPETASIRLKAKGNINYTDKIVEISDEEAADVPLGNFHQEGQDTHSTEDNWETENAIVVIPQEIPAGEPCLWFTADGKQYTFTPQTEFKLEVGKVNNLHLGVTVDGPVLLEGITVTDWTETDIDGGVAEEVLPYTYDESTNTYTILTADALNTAISNAKTSGTAENPAIINLAADVEVASTLDEWGMPRGIEVDEGVITLDLNGHTIKWTGDDSCAAVMVDNGATLTINDSSKGKQGKITNAEYVLNPDNGKLIINGGTFEGRYAVWGFDNNSTIEINGGTFIATYDAVYAQSSILTITGGTFIGDRYALSMNSSGTASITGGSFSGGEYDIDTSGVTGFLSYNEETGVGPTFPGGLSIWTSESTGFNLNALLADGAAYYDADGAKIELDASAASYDGDVTVKKVAATE